MAGWHHWLDGRKSEWTPGVGDGQGGLACCDSWGRKELDTTERLNWTELIPQLDPEWLGDLCARGILWLYTQVISPRGREKKTKADVWTTRIGNISHYDLEDDHNLSVFIHYRRVDLFLSLPISITEGPCLMLMVRGPQPSREHQASSQVSRATFLFFTLHNWPGIKGKKTPSFITLALLV